MNKREYMEKLLLLCTTSQKELFSRMYPNKVEDKKIDWAIKQLENTLKKGNEEIEIKQNKIKGLEEMLEKTLKENSSLQNDVKELSKKTIQFKNVDDNELLNALFAHGLDNWEGYEIALESLEKENE